MSNPTNPDPDLDEYDRVSLTDALESPMGSVFSEEGQDEPTLLDDAANDNPGTAVQAPAEDVSNASAVNDTSNPSTPNTAATTIPAQATIIASKDHRPAHLMHFEDTPPGPGRIKSRPSTHRSTFTEPFRLDVCMPNSYRDTPDTKLTRPQLDPKNPDDKYEMVAPFHLRVPRIPPIRVRPQPTAPFTAAAATGATPQTLVPLPTLMPEPAPIPASALVPTSAPAPAPAPAPAFTIQQIPSTIHLLFSFDASNALANAETAEASRQTSDRLAQLNLALDNRIAQYNIELDNSNTVNSIMHSFHLGTLSGFAFLLATAARNGGLGKFGGGASGNGMLATVLIGVSLLLAGASTVFCMRGWKGWFGSCERDDEETDEKGDGDEKKNGGTRVGTRKEG